MKPEPLKGGKFGWIDLWQLRNYNYCHPPHAIMVVPKEDIRSAVEWFLEETYKCMEGVMYTFVEKKIQEAFEDIMKEVKG